jgi:hypothetical protein
MRVSFFVFIGVTRDVTQTQFCQSLVISCSRMKGKNPAFRDTLIVRSAGSNDC